MAGDGDVVYRRRRSGNVWADIVMSRIAGGGDVSYGRR